MNVLHIIAIFLLGLISALCEGKELHVFAGQQQKSDWSKAFDFCKGKGKNLVTTLDKKAHDDMTDAIHRCSDRCGKHLTFSWTAANDLDKDWEFVWKGINVPVNMDLKNWQPGQPDHHNNDEHCVVAWSPDNPKYHRVYLNDRPCGESNHIICE